MASGKNWTRAAGKIWPVLVEAAKDKKKPTLTYEQVAPFIPTNALSVGYALGPIQQYCLDKGHPALTSIVVGKARKIPGDGFIGDLNNLPAIQEAVYSFDWNTLENPFLKSFGDCLRQIANNFSQAKTQKFKEHQLADLIRNDWPVSMGALLPASTSCRFIFVASPGQGQWADAPWFAVLNPSITTSAQAGYYPVYLFEPGFKTVCLVLGQGADKLIDAAGKPAALVELTARAKALRENAKGWKRLGFIEGPFETRQALKRPTQDQDPWSASVAFGKRYNLEALPTDQELADDLGKMLHLYDSLASKQSLHYSDFDSELADLIASNELPPTSPEKFVDGAKRIIKHKAVESRTRNGKLVEAVKKHYGSRCQACELDLSEQYGQAMAGYIEAHHLEQLSKLPAAGAELTVKDFAVLCSNCHKAIHYAGCPNLEEFKKSVSRPWSKLPQGDR